MKKSISILLLITSSLVSKSQTQLQNSHWIREGSISSPSLHLAFEGYKNGQYAYSVTNKQPCTSRESIYMGDLDTIVTILSGKTKHLFFTAPYKSDTIWCKALDSCSLSYDTCYWGVTTASVLPLSFTSFDAVTVGDSIHVIFSVGEASNVKYFRIRKSNDAKDWIDIPLPDAVVPNKTYYVTIKK